VTITVWRDGTWKVWEHRAALHAEADPGFLVNISEEAFAMEASIALAESAQAKWRAVTLQGTYNVESQIVGLGVPADEPTVVGE
jgi:hypothetical protein